MPKKMPHDHACSLDLDRLMADLESLDEDTRCRAVRNICPCRMDWNVFEQFSSIVLRLQKDPSPKVRAAALHVFEDTFQIISEALPTTSQEITNDMIATKRARRGRMSEEEHAWRQEREAQERGRTAARRHR